MQGSVYITRVNVLKTYSCRFELLELKRVYNTGAFLTASNTVIKTGKNASSIFPSNNVSVIFPSNNASNIFPSKNASSIFPLIGIFPSKKFP